jgi:hypothetical protein
LANEALELAKLLATLSIAAPPDMVFAKAKDALACAKAPLANEPEEFACEKAALACTNASLAVVSSIMNGLIFSSDIFYLIDIS